MRILFCNYEYPPLGGGGGVINALLAEELASRHEVTVLTSQGPGLPRDAEESGVRVIRVPVWFRKRQATANMGSMLAYVLKAPGAGRRHLGHHGYDVINTHFALPSGPVGHRLSRGYRIPNVLSVHGGDLYDPSKITSPHRHPALRTWIRRLVRHADAVVGQSENTLDNLHRFYTPEVEAVRIPLGIRRPPAGKAVRSDYGFGENDVVLVTVGRVVARKAIHHLLEMVAHLRDLPVRLLVVGDGPLIPSLRQQAGELELDGRVVFTGRVGEQEKFQILRMADLFVSTSQHEGFGLVFLEAMACGLPVVCFDHGGQTDFLADSVTGALVSLNDMPEFTARCRELIERGDRRRRVGEENLGRVEEFFIECCAGRYEEIFETTIERYERRS